MDEIKELTVLLNTDYNAHITEVKHSIKTNLPKKDIRTADEIVIPKGQFKYSFNAKTGASKQSIP